METRSSIGRVIPWVVDLVGLDLPQRLGPARGWFPSDAFHATERFSRPDINTFVYQVTIEDPKVLAKPWVSVPRVFTLAPGKRLYEYYAQTIRTMSNSPVVQLKSLPRKGRTKDFLTSRNTRG